MAEQETRISLVRHGRVHNPNTILYGRLPGFSLSETGREDAGQAARLLRNEPVAAIYSSPLRRAVETAHAIARFHSASQIQIQDLLIEVYTPFEGRPAAAADARGGDVYTGSRKPFEQPRDVFRRANSFFLGVRKTHRGQHVAAVTHGDVIVFMALWSRGLEPSAENKVRFSRLNILDGYPATGSVTTFRYLTDSDLERPLLHYQAPTSGRRRGEKESKR